MLKGHSIILTSSFYSALRSTTQNVHFKLLTNKRLYFEKFLKKLADAQCSSTTKRSIYHMSGLTWNSMFKEVSTEYYAWYLQILLVVVFVCLFVYFCCCLFGLFVWLFSLSGSIASILEKKKHTKVAFSKLKTLFWYYVHFANHALLHL